MTWEHVSPILKVMIWCGFIVGVVFGLLGIWLIYLGASGETAFSFFGQTFKSANVGIAAIFLGAAVIVLIMRSVTQTVRHTITSKEALSRRHRRNR
jgi:heme/copper-type cytochrome/quinol oxidase subunit 2